MRVVIAGAAGRDFHVFNTVFRDQEQHRVVAFTATQIPGIAGRAYPASLAGSLYPKGIPILAEDDLEEIVGRENVDEVILAYSDLSHDDTMHQASRVLATGADFRLVGPKATMLEAEVPVVAVCAARTGCGKSQTSRRVAELLLERGLEPALVRHPMPYGDLDAMRVQRFTSSGDIDAASPTIEDREEYEAPVAMGITVFAGVDYGQILTTAQKEADVIIWDGGNNDFPFYRPDLLITVVDALRPGHERHYHPGETNVRMADVIVVNKVDTADPEDVREVVESCRALNPSAEIIEARSPAELDDGPALDGLRALVVEDGPTITH
ncbi:MAG: GTP-binding protein, partial [Nitriliruptorales bacterium]|nr:GTP-binding protein [Nitriliruptorales bacterium]